MFERVVTETKRKARRKNPLNNLILHSTHSRQDGELLRTEKKPVLIKKERDFCCCTVNGSKATVCLVLRILNLPAIIQTFCFLKQKSRELCEITSGNYFRFSPISTERINTKSVTKQENHLLFYTQAQFLFILDAGIIGESSAVVSNWFPIISGF